MNNTTSKILIVDDNTFYLSLLKTILKDIGADIYVASSGRSALELINENDFALAVLDIQMPEMDGFELAGCIQKLQNRDLLPIIFLTAYFSDDIQMFKGYDNGAIDYLIKPVNKTIFISKVKIFLELDRQKRNLIDSKEILQKSKLEIEESKKKYLKLYDFAPTGYLTINSDGRIIEINRKGTRLLSQIATPFINQNFNEFVATEMLQEWDFFLNRVNGCKKNSGCEMKLKQTKEKPIYVYLEGAIIEKRQKCLISMVDITALKEAQIALKESEELYHSLLKTSPDGIIITDLEGNVTEASNTAADLLGNKTLEIEGEHFTQFIPKESGRTLVKILRTMLREGIVQNLEIILSRLDKTEFAGEISASQIKGDADELKAFMVVIRNISERKKIEKQMRHSERMAGIGELATGMAHEINQPLNTISLSIDNIIFSLENNTFTETYLKTKINKVFDNITRIKKIIDHVRTFSRDQEDFELSKFQINTSIRNSISMISEQITTKEINLTFKPDKKIPTLRGNAYRFEQVILNLLINARDAIEEKKKKNYKKFDKKIDVSTKLYNKQAVIEVRDNGIGISPEDIERVLLPFFTTKAPGQGTGLGLSISYGIIRELGGEIEIQSKPRIGTTIQIKIPV